MSRADSMACITNEAEAGCLIAFACGPNEAAVDKSPNQRNSLLTYHLLQHITEPNLKIDEIVKRTNDGILKDANGQLPNHQSGDLHTSIIYLNSMDGDFTEQNTRSKYH